MGNEEIEFIVFQDLIKEEPIKDDKGIIIGERAKLVKKDIACKVTIKRWDLSVMNYLTEKGKVSKTRCFVKDAKSNSTFIVKGSYEKTKEKIFGEENSNQVFIKGYKRWDGQKR